MSDIPENPTPSHRRIDRFFQRDTSAALLDNLDLERCATFIDPLDRAREKEYKITKRCLANLQMPPPVVVRRKKKCK